MARYAQLLGRRVDVLYRAGDLQLPASGKLVSDSGKSVFLEDSFGAPGSERTFRWELPYACIIRLTATTAAPSVREPSFP